jgi:hypothetical protein
VNRSRKKPGAPAPATLLPAFAELKPRLDSGDVLLFGGDSRISRGIKRFQGSAVKLEPLTDALERSASPEASATVAGDPQCELFIF